MESSAYFQSVAALLAIAGTVSCGSKGLGSGPIDGQVLDAVSRQPIAGALVVAKWGRAEGFVTDNVHVCRHVATASTDAQGRYHLDPWQPGNGVSQGPFDSRFNVALDAYKPGMADARHGVIKIDEMTSTIELSAWSGTHEQRMDWLRATLSSSELSCGGADDSENALGEAREAIYQEAKSIATNDAGDQQVIQFIEKVRSMESMLPRQESGNQRGDTRAVLPPAPSSR
jgi:hypothetical protein